jgi:uncharacterized membrane protein (Fun14 family)
MGFLRKFFVELIFVGVIVGWAVTKFPEIVTPWVPWLCLAVVWHLAWEVLPRQRIRGFFSSLQGKRFALGILAALITTALLSVFVLWATGVATSKLEVAEKAKEERTVPSNDGNTPNQPQGPTQARSPSQPSNQPSTPAPKSKIQPNTTTEDLEVLDFDSIQGVTLHNGYDETVIVLGIVSALTVPESMSSSTNQELEIGPKRTQQFKFTDPGKSFQLDTIKPLADTWEGQMAAAERAYYGCVFPLFLSSDSFQMKQVVDHYMQTLGSRLPVGDATGEITYRIGPKTKTKKFPLIVMASAVEGCVPKQH